MNQINVIEFDKDSIFSRNEKFISVDEWKMKSDDKLITTNKGNFIVPLTKLFNLNIDPEIKFDYFVLATKKCYNSDKFRAHLERYINYFEKFYDEDKEYISILYHFKTIIDRVPMEAYPPDQLYNDIHRYILSSDIERKIGAMVEDNYILDLNYTNPKYPSLQYTNEHGKLLYRVSMLMQLSIPILTNYIYMNKIGDVDNFLLKFYERVLFLYHPIDLYSKLCDTALSHIQHNQKSNKIIWDMQDIRGIDATTYYEDTIDNLILNVLPKCEFQQNIVNFNCSAIRFNTKHKVTDIAYEFAFSPISSSKRDEDFVSDFDKHESNLIKQNESFYLKNKVNYENVMNILETKYGPFNDDEIYLYVYRLMTDKDGNIVMNEFQRNLIFDMFYKYFRDVESIKSIDAISYVKLIIIAKRILIANNMILLPYVLSGKMDKIIRRKNINKSELLLIESSPTYQKILDKYRNEDIKKDIYSIIGTILSSDFTFVDTDKNIDGLKIDISAHKIIQEILDYILLC